MTARILIVDDEESLRFTFSEFLRDEGYQVVTADRVDRARQLLQDTDIDLIISDIVMPHIGGIDFLAYCQAHHAHIPVVLVTGFPTMETATAALRRGAYDYIAKPVTQTVLLKTARQALQFKQAQDEKRSSQAHLEAVFRSVRDCIISVDRQLQVVAMNDAARQHSHFSRLKPGTTFVSAAPTCVSRCVAALRRTLAEGATVEEKELKCECDPHRERFVSLHTTPLTTATGEPMGAVLVLRDETRLRALERTLQQRRQFERIVGESPPMQEIYALLERLAEVPTTVLITGESGTGKELIVDALHQRGPRRDKPLVKVNCAALTENLLATELFGHVKGAFTGAVRDNAGRFEMAQGGTIFLDEIGDISMAMQVRLLRVLQEKVIERVGDATPIPVDVRVVAATHQDLAAKIRQGAFREDLFYRLKVVNIALPALRERRTDIPLLIAHFIALFNSRYTRHVGGVSAAVERCLVNHDWPGNIRELEHVIEHAFILCRSGIIELADLPPDLSHPAEAAPLTRDDSAAAIKDALARAGGNKAKAARLLNISRRTLYRKLAELNIASD